MANGKEHMYAAGGSDITKTPVPVTVP
jgi:hypothetical protein